MKVAVLLAYAVLTTRGVTGAAIRAPLDIISLDDISQSDRGALQFLNRYRYPPRGKRSGEDALNSIKAAIGQGIKSKLSLLAKGSAAASSKLSSSSSKGHSFHHHDVHPDYHPHKSFDFWSLKKSILNTLLQAVKAIKGGVIAAKGQLIKGSGYLISAKGKLISSKGESITTLGKNIAASAVLSPAHGHGHGHSEELTHGHYHHIAPEEYGSPSAPGPEYEAPEHHYHHHADHPDHGPSGILILKKIPTHDGHSEHSTDDHHVPDFKPIDHTGPSFGEIVGKFFSASSSLTPGYPGPFGDDGHDHVHHPPADHQDHHSHDDHHDHHSNHEAYHESHHTPHSSHVDSHHHEYSSSAHGHGQALSQFEQAPEFLNLAEYASESKSPPRSVIKFSEIQKRPEALNLQPAASVLTYDAIKSAATDYSSVPGVGYDNSPVMLDSQIPQNLFDVSLSDKPTVASAPPQIPQNSISLSSAQPPVQTIDFTNLQFGGFSNPGTADTGIEFLTAPLKPQSMVFPRQNSFDNINPQSPYPQSVKDHAFLDTAQSEVAKELLKIPTQSNNNSYFGYTQLLDFAQSPVVKDPVKPPTRSKNNTYSGYPQSVKNHAYMDNLQSSVFKEVRNRPSRSKNSNRKRPPRPNSFPKPPRPGSSLQHYPNSMKTLHLGPDRPKRL